MKITLVGPVYPYRGGIAHYTARLAQELSRDHQVNVLSFRKQFPPWLYPGQSDRDPSQRGVSVAANFLLEPLNPLSWWRSAGWIQEARPDLVLIQWWVTFWSPAYTILSSLCRRQHISVVYLIHNVLPHEGSWVHRPLARLALSRGRYFIIHTEAERKRLEELIPGASILVRPFPVYDMLAGQESIPKVEARRRLALPDDARILLFFGIVRPYKGLGVLLEALAQLNERQQKFFLVVAGEFWQDKSTYLAQIEALQLKDQVCLEDRYIPNEELPMFFSAADIAVAPYTAGTQSAVAALALGFGIPLVTTDRSAAGLSDSDRQQVRIVRPGDATALAGAIEAAFTDFNDHPFSHPKPDRDGWDRIVEAIEEIYQMEKKSNA